MPSWTEVITIAAMGVIVWAAVRAMQRATTKLDQITDRFAKPSAADLEQEEERDMSNDITPRDPSLAARHR